MDDGNPKVLKAVLAAERDMLDDLAAGKRDNEYLGIDGLPALKEHALKLAFGADCPTVREGRVASAQTISGSGALRVVAEFIARNMPQEHHEVWVSDPSWEIHARIMKLCGLNVKFYPYWDPVGKRFDFEGCIAALKTAAPGSPILLQTCAHNPTGIDPTEEQWEAIANLMKERRLIPWLDSAYQGFASGSLERDAFSMRLFMSMGFEFFLCQSFSKNMGMYGQRVGMAHVVCSSSEVTKAVLSEVKMIIRPMYSNPPKHGAHVAANILEDSKKFKLWEEDLIEMSERIKNMRHLLRSGLEAKGTPGNWEHVTTQIGMFSYLGLTEAQCDHMMEEHHIYLLRSSRISMAGLNKRNMDYMVDCVDKTVRHTSKL
jgi:aspartate aminotransferase